MLFNQHMKPSFMIIGGVKCGTSSLYRYLNKHPLILPCKTKEPRIFSTRNIFKTIYKLPAYFQMFPKKDFEGFIDADWITLTETEEFTNTTFRKEKEAGKQYITGEASADTFVKAKPWVIKKLLPHIKLIVLLRNPTERFISHYKMYQRFASKGKKQYKQITLDDFITNQLTDFENGNYKNVLGQGMYIKHLNRWTKYFLSNEICILETKDLANPTSAQVALNKIFVFLNLPQFTIINQWQKYNVSKKEILVTKEKVRLDEFYSPFNEALSNKFGIDF